MLSASVCGVLFHGTAHIGSVSVQRGGLRASSQLPSRAVLPQRERTKNEQRFTGSIPEEDMKKLRSFNEARLCGLRHSDTAVRTVCVAPGAQQGPHVIAIGGW